MPTTYTHYRFGKDVLAVLPDKYKKIITAHRELYDMGLHGPDLLFYYKPLSSCAVNEEGMTLHYKPGEYFFKNAARVLDVLDYPPAHLAYVYGYLCHFALDAACHGYIGEYIEKTGVTHSEIEMEFDRLLLVKDGIKPLHAHLAKHIRPSQDTAKVIATFYPTVDDKEIYKAMKSMVFYENRKRAPGRLWRSLIFTVFKIGGKYDSMHGMVMSLEPSPKCAESNSRLSELYDKAIGDARRLITEFETQPRGKDGWSDEYRYNFESVYVPRKSN